MKNIGLVVALKEEIEQIYPKIGKIVKKYNVCNLEVTEFRNSNKKIFLITSGIGMVASAIATELLIAKFGVEIVVNFGIVGALKKNQHLQNVVAVGELVHYDFSLDFADESKNGCYPEDRNNPIFVMTDFTKEFIRKFTNLEMVRIACGDKFINSTALKDRLVAQFNVDICDMESFAIFKACEIAKIPLISIKSVSDRADENSNNSFEQIVAQGINCYSNVIESVIKNL
ncbi:MAG: 5'-methylthioadenosine/S-adenosylhomocysteine nucleosidase [Clostridia bacterium]